MSQACRRPGADERARARAAAPELLPWGTHAYVIGAAQAERMARLADLLVARSAHPVDEMHTTTWQLDGEDVKIDHFLSLVYSNLTVAAERSRRCPTLPRPYRCAPRPAAAAPRGRAPHHRSARRVWRS